ncbi:nucleotidyltransferase family protein [Deinococcus koreensis]|uniref:DNA polymerase III subunit beta n=1 Tax=Deinococcus koreensis TaxID=2054903 RepID=A0A2K3V2V1_9DEIO|nr:nucleotidyltransferase domain-containing protein [Deinococcus koreensis]PNY83112.1 DNA polymerase III subunit beta [Deinococcus koreensis]
MRPLDLIETHRADLERLLVETGVVRLELFGSALTPDYDPSRSDLDFLVEFAPETDLGPWLSRFFDLRDALSRLLGRPVDLVSRQALGSAPLRRQAQDTRTLIYAA